MSTLQQLVARANAGDTLSQEHLALACEQAGLPEEAAGWLARAAEGGSASALSRLGLWELAGFGVPRNPESGVARIYAGARRKDELGLHLASVVDAGGIGVPRDPRRALGWLVTAAHLGHGRAVNQLLLLGQGAVRPTGHNWEAIAAAVDLSPFERDVERRVEREDPPVSFVDDLLPGWACDYVIGMAAPVLMRGKVVDERGGESVRGERSNTVMTFGLADSDVVLELINNLIARAAGMPPEHAEGLGVLHYDVGERYAAHIDAIPETPQNFAHLAARGQRVRTLLVYLNEGFEGGATEFPRLGAAYKPPRGSAVIFDSVRPDGSINPLSLHTGAPPTSGEKWVISKWFRSRPLRPVAPTAS